LILSASDVALVLIGKILCWFPKSTS